ncbi:hypothetical protein QYE76_052820 [Lolium multiflorum]|uniref:Uncharacterized protein n=1 Tax=Lolium multiflorum TaxID=4521 RepID=A0AAD8WJU4_LOLMU|nr:hypothetical protein QYE76_052820 [Lolium multiflorum]
MDGALAALAVLDRLHDVDLAFRGLVILGVELPPAPADGVGGEDGGRRRARAGAAAPPSLRPDDYLDDEQFNLILPQLGVNPGLAPGNFIVERELDTVVASSRAPASRTRTRTPTGGTSLSSRSASSSTSSATRSEEPTRRHHGTGLR